MPSGPKKARPNEAAPFGPSDPSAPEAPQGDDPHGVALRRPLHEVPGQAEVAELQLTPVGQQDVRRLPRHRRVNYVLPQKGRGRLGLGHA